ncbi:RNA pyrophosphohydrolase [Celeribacter indicus]|uniref:RNA pyrophosphohydrolase n=1 Tax=Celeribacter indicus TaxID=1208324 RepID=A0A0B5DU67_9RHOB|nr:RNA pyrophosphohydrolase [Celeribacter indicus]AJE44770.1 RNA pyrophosphohydrolase [Celeribacter indicus]SDX46543.1 putative (di)nucleoside polyphosphate hydrolase [Celeribacter indicus]
MTEFSDLPYRPCVGIVLTDGEGRIFVGERIDTPGAWQMPQGGIDAGEEPQEAALRELGEEIGLGSEQVEVLARTADWLTYDLPDHLLGKVWNGKYKGQRQLWFLLRLTGPEEAIDIATDHPEFSRWKWTDRAGLLSDIVPFKRDIYEEIVREFSASLA